MICCKQRDGEHVRMNIPVFLNVLKSCLMWTLKNCYCTNFTLLKTRKPLHSLNSAHFSLFLTPCNVCPYTIESYVRPLKTYMTGFTPVLINITHVYTRLLGINLVYTSRQSMYVVDILFS